MLAFTVNDTKAFMAHLLKGELFDGFTFRQGEILTYAAFTLNGSKDADYMEENDTEPYCLWTEIKPFVFQSVKGKRLPKSMKLVLSLPQKDTAMFANTKAVFLNLLFREGSLLCTTATAQENFSLDKQGDSSWEIYVLDFFKAHNIGIQIEK